MMEKKDIDAMLAATAAKVETMPEVKAWVESVMEVKQNNREKKLEYLLGYKKDHGTLPKGFTEQDVEDIKRGME